MPMWLHTNPGMLRLINSAYIDAVFSLFEKNSDPFEFGTKEPVRDGLSDVAVSKSLDSDMS